MERSASFSGCPQPNRAATSSGTAVLKALPFVFLLAGVFFLPKARAGEEPDPTLGESASAPARFGFGRPASEEEIAAWDIDVRPDGTGLPPGRGTVAQGAALYAARCASCHGATGVEGPKTRLAGRIPGDAFPFGTDPKARRTIGNYWPYAPTIFDYTRRAMPADAPGSLSDDEVYALTAYLLHLNDLLPADGELDARSLPAIRMPARDRFVPDDRRGGPEVR